MIVNNIKKENKMCLLAICIDRKASLQDLYKGWSSNNDGGGIAWMGENRKVEYIKGIKSVEELHNLILATPLPLIYHLRLKSIGAIDPLLTHPFEISADSPLKLYNQCKSVLFQNGTETWYDKYLAAAGLETPIGEDGKETAMSDSRAIAMCLSRSKNNKFLKHASGKFVVAGYKNAKDVQWIRYYGDFTEDDGILYSNTHWKYKTHIQQHCQTHYGHGCGDSDYDGYAYNRVETQSAAPEAKKKSHRQTIRYPNH